MDGLDDAREVLAGALKDSYEDNVLHWAAAVAFYSALSFAPLLLLAIMVTSPFADESWAASRLAAILANFLPDESDEQLRDFVSEALRSRGRIGLLSGIAFLYTGTRAFAALARAIHVIYHDEEDQQVLRQIGVQIVMLLTLGTVFLLALSSRQVFKLLAGDAGSDWTLAWLIGGLIQIGMLFVAFSLIYRFIPSRERNWRPAFVGGAVATLLFVVVRPLFLFYLDRFGQEDLIYGSLASLAILLVWIWIVAIITLFGAEIASSTKGLHEDQRE